MKLQSSHAVACLAALTALSSNARAQESRTRDSSGVKVIEHDARKDAPIAFRLGDKPLLEVGGGESNVADQFEHSQGYLRGVRLSDGGVAVIDVSRVHYFDANGKRTLIVGNRRPQPGPFYYLTSICRTNGDTLVLNDMHDESITVLDRNGIVLRKFFQKDNGSAPFSFCFDDGTFVLERSVGEILNGQRGITRLRADGSIVNPVGTFQAPPFDMVTGVTLTVVASGDALYTGNPFTGEIREHDALGRLRRIIRTTDQGDSIAKAEAEERMDKTIPLNVVGADRTRRMDMMRARPYASRWPVMMDYLVGTDRTIWVRDFKKVHPSPDFWTAIDSAGKIVGRLEVPLASGRVPSPQVISFGRDYVMLRRFDENRLTYVSTYPLRRIDGRSP